MKRILSVAAIAAALLVAGDLRAGDARASGGDTATGQVEKEIERVIVDAEGDGGAKKIVIKKRLGDCEGDDCEGRRVVRKVFVDEHGERHEVHGGGHGWMAEHAAGPRGFLGVGLTELTGELRAHFGAPEAAGVMVSKVVPGSPAERAGVEVGDIIASVGDVEVASAAALAAEIGRREDGETVELGIWREREPLRLSAALETRVAGGAQRREIRIECEGDEDCGEGFAADIGYDCGDAESCEVLVECGDAGCHCTANGESIDCSEIPGFKAPSG